MTTSTDNYLTDREEHENLIRRDAVEFSMAMHPYKSMDEILDKAKEIERYILGKQPQGVVGHIHPVARRKP